MRRRPTPATAPMAVVLSKPMILSPSTSPSFSCDAPPPETTLLAPPDVDGVAAGVAVGVAVGVGVDGFAVGQKHDPPAPRRKVWSWSLVHVLPPSEHDGRQRQVVPELQLTPTL
jgi:hypothetical protein